MRDEVPVTGGRTKPAAIMGAGRMPAPSTPVIWHDLECGSYHEDLELWRELADAHDGPILDVGAGTGRVTIDLAARGHSVVALDMDADLLAALRERAEGLGVETVAADARGFDLGDRRFGLVIVPMQTLQLLGGPDGRAAFLRAAHAHLAPGGVLAAALADPMEGVTDDHTEPPLPDLDEVNGVVYHSQVVALRVWPEATRIDRVRQTVDLQGNRTAEDNKITLDRVGADEVAEEAEALGFTRLPTRLIAMTDDYVGSEVVMLCRP